MGLTSVVHGEKNPPARCLIGALHTFTLDFSMNRGLNITFRCCHYVIYKLVCFSAIIFFIPKICCNALPHFSYPTRVPSLALTRLCFYSAFAAATMRGPTLSPVALLCFTCAPSQSGKVPDCQQRQKTPFLPGSSFCSRHA